MATKTKNAGDSTEAKTLEVKSVTALSPEEAGKKAISDAYQENSKRDLDRREKEGISKYPAVRVLSGAELDAYKNQKVDVEKAERFLAQKDKEEYWRNKKEQKRKKTET